MGKCQVNFIPPPPNFSLPYTHDRNHRCLAAEVDVALVWFEHSGVDSIPAFFRLCYDDCVQADAGRGRRGGRTRDAGVVEAGRGRSGGRTRVEWTQDAGALEAGRGQISPHLSKNQGSQSELYTTIRKVIWLVFVLPYVK